MNYAWNWSILIEPPYLGWLASGLGLTLVISLAAWLFALLAGTLVGLAGTLPGLAARAAARLYVGLFRNVPLLLQLFLWFFVVPELLPARWGFWLKRELPYPEFWTAIVALGLFTSARVAVQVGSGIAAVPRGQTMAALAGGMSLCAAYRFVLLPQAFRLVLPPMTSDFLTVFKNSALALTIGVFELTAQSRQIESYTFQGFEAFTAATVVYLVIALAVTGVMRGIERRTALPGGMGQG
ncbi:amino acid ABC transporter permease [Phreatobacter stygius]|uniref:Amino acid ABC transporter permease n=1 Tax=Phreatobacter stygius TaxID=1940610 RepID=A0A4D7B8A8_9HYPH|nr:amino acid ABC transporter permease [Phreatobacter stygius]QCI67083.1 amino acid ABC transporter permease [Phreatobacter stygius]